VSFTQECGWVGKEAQKGRGQGEDLSAPEVIR
jgi:hypothetical protein